MRKLLMAVMLMGAAFAGGAVVNGPGLQWLRDNVLNKLGGDAEAAADEGDAAVPEASPRAVEEDIPSAPLPALAGDAATRDKPKGPAEPGAGKPAPAPSPAPTPKPAEPAVAQAPSKPAEAPRPAEPARPEADAKSPATLLAEAPAPAPVAALPPLEPPVDAEAPPGPAKDRDPGQGGAEPPAPRAVEAPPAAKPKTVAAASGPWADAPDSGPAAAVPPKGYQKPAEADAAVAKTATAGGDWPALRRQMKALGVSRYAFEGEPDGRVRFHCVIPLAGRRAVGQQFEGEGDDEFQAAQVALRRVALWQATENR